MDHRDPTLPGGSNDPTTHRRARAYSQPVGSPIPGPSHRPPDPFDFLHSYAGQNPSTGFPQFGSDYEDDALFRSLLAMSEDQQGPQSQLHPPPFPLSQLPPMAPPPASLPQHMQNPQLNNPLISQTFLAWLQYMQLQMQLQHQTGSQHPSGPVHPQQPPHPQQQQAAQHTQHQSHVPFPSHPFSLPFSSEPVSPQSPLTPEHAGGGRLPTNTPSPEANEPAEGDTGIIAEEKRRRNTAASARFRVKKKQWTLNLERSITDLSGRVEELEREAAELRRENGWLKEIVMLKSKRFGGQAPEAGPQNTDSSDTQQHKEDDAQTPDDAADDGDEANTSGGGRGKGKEVQR